MTTGAVKYPHGKCLGWHIGWCIWVTDNGHAHFYNAAANDIRSKSSTTQKGMDHFAS
jgi:hypothetical protein